MGASKSILSYNDAKEVFERAAASSNGVRLEFDGGFRARDNFMYRLWNFRKLDREQNRVLYPDPGHTMHGRSLFDTFSVRKIGPNAIEIQKIDIGNIKIVDL